MTSRIMRASVDLIILDIDGGEMLVRCLDSVLAMSLLPDRIILVDNGSADPVSRRPAMSGYPIEILRNDSNIGFAAGVNRGVAASAATWVALLNNDVTVEPEWLAELVETLESDPSLASAQTIIVRPDGCVDGAGIDLSDGTIRQLGYGERIDEVEADRAFAASATAVVYRREAVDEVAGHEWFLESLVSYYEDVELGVRLDRADWKHRTLPEPLATHLGSASAGEVPMSRRSRMKTRNRHLIARSYPEAISRQALLVEDLAEVARAVRRGRLVQALSIVAGTIVGTFAPLPERESQGKT